MQGEKGVIATVEIPSIDGEKQTNSSGRFRNENATTVTMTRTDLNLAWPYPGFHERFFPRVRLHDLDSAETGNRAWKVSGAQGSPVVERKVEHWKSCSVSSALFLCLISRCVVVPIIGWFSKRTGTSVDDGARKSNNWVGQWLCGKLGTGSRVQSFPRAFPSSNDVPVLLLGQPYISHTGNEIWLDAQRSVFDQLWVV